MTDPDYAAGAAYIDGRYMPIGEAAIPITDWGYRRSDVTYDVVGVWNGAFFRLDDHLRRFRASMQALRLQPAESDDDIRRIADRFAGEGYHSVQCSRARRTTMQATEISGLTIASAAAAIRQRSLSPVELTESYLGRIDRLNPTINAYVTLTRERALADER